MIKENIFYFDRELNKEELNLWSTFFDYFPCHHNRGIQSILNDFNGNVSKKEWNIQTVYEELKKFNNNKEMIEKFSEIGSWTKDTINSYAKTISELQKIIPVGKPIEFFLMSIYSGSVQDWNIEINSKGIGFTSLYDNLWDKTYAPQVAMVADLMAGRINDIFTTLKVNPIKIYGEIKLEDKNNKSFCVFVHKNNNNSYVSNSNFGSTIERYTIFNEKINLDFSYDFSKNTNESKRLYSPMQDEQKNLLSLINKNYIDSLLTQNTKQKNKNKI